jgi:hypothetical protein
VITTNTTISGQGVTLFIQMLTDLMGEADNVARINYDALTATMRRGRATIANPCVCRKAKALATCVPFPSSTNCLAKSLCSVILRNRVCVDGNGNVLGIEVSQYFSES